MIITSTARAAALAAVEYENNPFVTGAAVAGTYSTSTGTEVLSADNAASGYTYDYWTATPASGFATWRVVYASAQSPTFVGIASHNIADVGGTVAVQYSTNSGASWASVGTDTPTDNQAIGFRFNAVAADYWRVVISGVSDDVSIGVIWIGNEIIIPRRLYQGYTPHLTPSIVDLNTNVSEGGHLLGSSYAERGSTFEAGIDYVEPSFIRGATWQAFQSHWNQGNGAFWAWRPFKYGDLTYAWRSQGMGQIAPANSGPQDLMGFSIQGRGFHE